MENILDELKEHLCITFNEEDKTLLRNLKSGKAYLEKLTGGEIDFIEDEDNKTLLFDYVRYLRSHSLEYFKVNYQAEIIALQLAEGMKEI